MRHGRRTKKFDRHSSHREAMLKNLAKNLLIYQQIETTLAKAKEARRLTEKLITLSKEDNLKNRRLAYDYLQDRDLIKRLFVKIAPLFKNRPGGYTRIVRTVNRVGDGSQMAILELVTKIEVPKTHKKLKKTKESVEKKQKFPTKAEPSQKEKEPKLKKPKPIKKEIPESQEQKKGIVSGLRKYFGRSKNK